MRLSNDMRRFTLKGILSWVAAISVALALLTLPLQYLHPLGYAILAGLFGYLLLFLSDVLDSGDIDQRTMPSVVLNLLGLAVIMGSKVFALFQAFIILVIFTGS